MKLKKGECQKCLVRTNKLKKPDSYLDKWLLCFPCCDLWWGAMNKRYREKLPILAEVWGQVMETHGEIVFRVQRDKCLILIERYKEKEKLKRINESNKIIARLDKLLRKKVKK